ncbi:hypothetical protein COU74_02300 [Candidatus Peregrinibacteria bacterium CG10_big_fil_rev_8_21_14_0_10_36_19]|nr:MAG: hypothetical protein COU74_02300 [Candidatus Peregrinibacteria bacterium CG10_big_fil_rev_8_21_14_0_10_36_19]
MICVPIQQNSFKSLLLKFKEAQKKANLTEIWFDSANLDQRQLDQVFKIKSKPIIYKCENSTFNKDILNYPIDYIDLDIKTPAKDIKFIKKNYPKIKIILSKHDFRATPTSNVLKKLAKKMVSNGADIVKIATFANSFSDSLRMLALLNSASHEGQKSIYICMGKYGKITRLTGHLLGNYLMFAPLTQAEKTASGQVSIDDLQKVIKLTK